MVSLAVRQFNSRKPNILHVVSAVISLFHNSTPFWGGEIKINQLTITAILAPKDRDVRILRSKFLSYRFSTWEGQE